MSRLGEHVTSGQLRIAADKEAATFRRTEKDVSGETTHQELLERAVTISERRNAWGRKPSAPDSTVELFSTDPIPVPAHSTEETTTLVRLVGRRHVSGSKAGTPQEASLHVQVVDKAGEAVTYEREWVRFGTGARFYSDSGDEIAKGLGIVHSDEIFLVDGHPSDFRPALSGEALEEVMSLLDLIDQQPHQDTLW